MNSEWTLECKWRLDQAIMPLLITESYSEVELTIIDYKVKISFVFSERGKLVNLKLPESIKTIRKQSFKTCDYLYGIDMGLEVKEIEDEAFYACSHLYSIRIPYGVERIGSNVFSFCNALNKIYIPHVVIIGNNIFDGCSNLHTIYIPFGSTKYFENFWPDLKDKLLEQIDGWKVLEKKHFAPEEIYVVKKAEIVLSQDGRSVCFFMRGGGQTYLPLLEESTLCVGDILDMNQAVLVTLEGVVSRNGYDYKEKVTRVFQ